MKRFIEEHPFLFGCCLGTVFSYAYLLIVRALA